MDSFKHFNILNFQRNLRSIRSSLKDFSSRRNDKSAIYNPCSYEKSKHQLK
ncbi:hypothetical protein THIOM_002467 [Candidatus Thiomargarita nelsonii]|uniref:Uncharacterized protein n=1 Tax=Candidatus Thiomargarita nelsonii TaxID=1003181 RepID=A0A176S168_9GAMM|nr:hypothetical protein THIOM_002467 [Candidatus Thiomargarita nelsonii]